MKKFHLLLALLAVALWANVAAADDKATKDEAAKDEAVKDDAGQAAGKESKEIKTVSGTSACATCEGVTEKGHNIMLVDKDGMRWVLIGSGDDYKKAHKVRDQGKKMTATLDGKATAKKDADGKEYKEAKIKSIKVEEEA